MASALTQVSKVTQQLLTNSALLAPHVGSADINELIPFVRGLPLGAVVGSTPALMEPPSQSIFMKPAKLAAWKNGR